MEIKKLSHFLITLIGLTTLTISSIACSLIKRVNPSVPDLTSTPTNMPLLVMSTPSVEGSASTLESRGISFCEWPPELIYSEGINTIFWSNDGKSIIFSTDNQDKWMKYDVESKTIQDLNESHNMAEYLQPQKNSDEIALNFGIHDFSDLFLSPTEKSIVFLKSLDGENIVFLKSMDSPDVFSLGTIYGVISNVYWIKNGDELLLSIDWLSPRGIKDAYVYKVDLINKKIDIEIPNQPEYRNLTMIGVTPNHQSLLFVKYSEQDRSVYLHNLSSKLDTKTSVEFPPLTYQWLSDDEFFAVGYLKDKTYPKNASFYVYKYNIYQKELSLLIDNPLSILPFSLNSALISPLGKQVAFIQSGNQALVLLTCR